MKPAIFQVNQPDGIVRLVCVYLPTMRSALDLQAFVRQSPGRNHVELLGRFDRIQVATSIHEAVRIAVESQARTGFAALRDLQGIHWKTRFQGL